jgi:hypothetical protein
LKYTKNIKPPYLNTRLWMVLTHTTIDTRNKSPLQKPIYNFFQNVTRRQIFEASPEL